MEIDEFTFNDIISYCDIDTKYVMRIICRRYANINISLPHLFLYRKAFKGAYYGSMRMTRYKCIDEEQNIYEDNKCIEPENIIKYASGKKISVWDLGLDCACAGGNREIIDMMIKKGSTNWIRGFQGACDGGHIEIIDMMIEKDKNIVVHNLSDGICGACLFGHKNVIEYLIKLGATEWNSGFSYACRGMRDIKFQPDHIYLNIMKLMKDKGAIYCYTCGKLPSEHFQ